MRKSRPVSLWSRLCATVKNWWEGAVRWSRERSSLPEENPRDARWDLAQVELTEIIRKCRYFAKNSPLFVRLQGLFAQYTVGEQGIKIVPASEDLDYNERVSEAWGEFCESIEVSGKDYSTVSEEGANTLFCDGSYFILKTFIEVAAKPGTPKFQPRIQLIERHRVQSPGGLFAQEGKFLHNGIQLDPKGRPIGYWVRDDVDDKSYRYYTTAQMEHVFDSTRPGQLDGMPILAPAINLLHDLSDLEIFQMKKAKSAAEVQNMVFRKGGVPPDDEAVLREGVSVTTENSQGTTTNDQRIKEYRQALGAAWAFFEEGEEVKQFKSESPSVTEQWHWSKVESQICAVAGISRMLVYPESMQGTVARADLEVTAATLRGWSRLQARAWVSIYLWWLEWAKQNDPRLKKAPTDYQKRECRPPRGPNVDVGRNGKQLLAEVEAGIRTYESAYSELQQDWRRELRQKAIEARYVADLAKEFDIEKSEISTLQEDRKERFDSGMQQGGGNVPAKKEKKDDDE